MTVFFSSHQLHEVEQIADSVCIIEQGRTVLQSDLDDLRASYRQVQLVFVDDAPRAGLQRPGVERLQQSGRSVSLLVSRDVEGVVEAARNHRATSINVRPVSLKEIFLSLVRIPMMSISRSDVMAISAERSDARLFQCETVIDIRQGF